MKIAWRRVDSIDLLLVSGPRQRGEPLLVAPVKEARARLHAAAALLALLARLTPLCAV